MFKPSEQKQTIFGLPLKIMYFNDGSTYDYMSAQKDLAVKLNLPQQSHPQEVEKALLATVKNWAIQLASGGGNQAPDEQVGLCQWIQSIHNEKIVSPEGARFPNNLVFDMLLHLRNKESLSPEESFLRFFLDGANARKISKGNTPELNFIATSQYIHVLNVAGTFCELSDKHQQFQNNHRGINSLIEAQRKLEAAASNLSADPIFAVLLNGTFKPFPKKDNPETGANCYLADVAVTNGVNSLNALQDENKSANIDQMVGHIANVLEQQILPDFIKAAKDATPSAIELGEWDASEWIARMHTALIIASKIDPKHEAVLNKLEQNDFLRDILARNNSGNYPGRVRDAAIAELAITELFTQASLSEQAKPIENPGVSFAS